MATATLPESARRAAGARARSSDRTRRAVAGWVFALPFVLLYAAFELFPLIVSVVMSFTDMRSTDLRDPLNINTVGLDNFARILGDAKFWQATWNTLVFVAFSVPFTLAIGLALGIALNSGVRRLRTVFRIGFYLPVISSGVAVAVIWRYLLSTDAGLINSALRLVGIDGPAWLNDTRTALPSLIAMAVWRHVGFAMVIFLAALQGIPRELYEAAEIDGAGRRQAFRHVTLPLLRPAVLFIVVISVIGNLQFFEEPFIMTQGGPLDTTTSISYQIYTTFGFGQYGYAAAMSWVLFVIIACLTLLQFRLMREK
ncbi:carbohydrate ABC transporter permease [Nonomuraea sp. NPDC050328]|uniref:carbohydrate ABC transporter permease n=1 Tax=Nonomuraea sp. NPDC050328 TaxID=3364361 RepID=UPI0037AF6E3F